MDLPLILDIIRTTVFSLGAVFTLVQLRLSFKQREGEMALRLLQSYQTADFQIAVIKIIEMKKGLSKNEIEKLLGEDLKSLLIMFGTFEALGVLVYKKQIKLSLVEDFFSGAIVSGWEKCSHYIFDLRKSTERETYYEWFQWLYERIKNHEKRYPPQPAHKQYK